MTTERSERQKQAAATYIVLAVLLAVYVGVYFSLVTPSYLDTGMTPARILPEYRPIAQFEDEHGNSAVTMNDEMRGWSQFFAPIHWFDRCMRPNIWNP